MLLDSIFRELVHWQEENHHDPESEALRFPLIDPLPFQLAEVVKEATKQYLLQSLQNSSLLLTIWNHPPPANPSKGKAASKAIAGNVNQKEEAVDIVNFIITMGTVAMQVSHLQILH